MVQGRTKQASAKAALVWLRRDPRLAGHRPLAGAGLRAGTILVVHVLDMPAAGHWQRVGGAPVLHGGAAACIIPEPARRAGAFEVHCGLSHEPWLRAPDIRAAAILARWRVGFHTRRVSTRFDASRIRIGAGKLYHVHTPFARTCRSLPAREPAFPAPVHILPPEGNWRSERLKDWRLVPTRPDRANGPRRLLAGHLADYGASLGRTGDGNGTSALPPQTLAPAGVVLDRADPRPIVSLREGRRRALDGFRQQLRVQARDSS